jgi:hypothetical protein
MHVLQVSLDVAVKFVEYCPAVHFEHAMEWSSLLYVPGVQREHDTFGSSMSFVKYPLSHLQSVSAVLPALDSEYAGHCAQVPFDVAAK